MLSLHQCRTDGKFQFRVIVPFLVIYVFRKHTNKYTTVVAFLDPFWYTLLTHS